MTKKVTHGKRTEAYQMVKDELKDTLQEGMSAPPPKAFTRQEWNLLPYSERVDYVKQKKLYVLEALKSKISSPIVGLITDLNDLEMKIQGQLVRDDEKDVMISPEYRDLIKLKIELAKAMKYLMDKGIIKHEHVIKRIDEDEVLDVNWSEVNDDGREEKAE